MIQLKSIFTTALFFILIISPVMAIAIYHPSMLTALIHQINRHTNVLCLIRWGMIISFVYAWPWLVTLIGNKRHMDPKTIDRWKKERISIGIWLILFECLICENLIFKLMHGG